MNQCSLSSTSIMSEMSSDGLFRELCNRFPEVPSDVVKRLMIEHRCDRQKCIEGLARVSNSYLFGQGDLVSDMSRVTIGNNPGSTVPYNHGVGYDSNFRSPSDSVGVVSGIGSPGPISINPHNNNNQTTHISNLYHRVDSTYTSAARNIVYESQPRPHGQVKIHISTGGGQGHGYNPSHSSVTQNPRNCNLPHPAWQEGQWNGDVSYHQEVQPPPQYSYPQPPTVQRQVTYEQEGGWTRNMHTGPSRPHNFVQMFPSVSNGHENLGSSPEAPSLTTVSSISKKGTPSTPPSCMGSQLRYGQSPEEKIPGGGNSLDYSVQTQVFGSNGQYLRQPAPQSSGHAVKSNQNTNFQSLIYIPPPRAPIRTPSPINPTPTSGFFGQQTVGSVARPPQSLPPFPITSQRSSDSSPGTPRHPHSIHVSNQQQQPHKRVVFKIPDGSQVHKEESAHHGYQETDMGYRVQVTEARTGDSQGYSIGQVQENRQRSGSIEESLYMQTLLEYQRQRKAKLTEDLQENYRSLQRLQNEVGNIEKTILERRKVRNTCTVTAEDAHKIRQENRRLQVEISLLTREIDVVNNGQTPLGVLDTHQLQSFYKNIEPGQRVSSQSNSRPSTPPKIYTYYQDPLGRPVRPPLPQHAPIAPQEEVRERENWTCSACTFLNHPDLDKCEMCEMPRLVRKWKDWELV